MALYKINSLYYPGSGMDFSTIGYYTENSSIKTFYYCDYLNDQLRPQSILDELRRQLPNYKINQIADIKPSYFNKSSWDEFWCEESDGQTFSGRKENSFIALYRLEAFDKIWELYYFGTEAIETYRVLLENKIKIDLVVTQDHGLGCLWTTFCKGSYLEAIARVNKDMPQYLLVGTDHHAWDGYKKISDAFGVFGVHEHQRIMYELESRSVDFFEFKEKYEWLYRRDNHSNSPLNKDEKKLIKHKNKMIETHLDFLIKIGDTDQGFVGNNSYEWAKDILPNENFDLYLNRRFDRYELFDYCQDSKNSDLNVTMAILSWGGMRRNNARLLFNDLEFVLKIANDLRKGTYKSRHEAFSMFQEYKIKKLINGIGIGFFTKLICFLAPELNGYIMDQWVSKSINLLTGKSIVNISNNVWVDDKKNTADTYELFCAQIDHLATLLKCSGYEAEKRIFSVGNGRGIWRNYLIQNYKK